MANHLRFSVPETDIEDKKYRLADIARPAPAVAVLLPYGRASASIRIQSPSYIGSDRLSRRFECASFPECIESCLYGYIAQRPQQSFPNRRYYAIPSYRVSVPVLRSYWHILSPSFMMNTLLSAGAPHSGLPRPITMLSILKSIDRFV